MLYEVITVVPGELFYRKPVMVMRGHFKPVTNVNEDMMAAGLKQFSQLAAVDDSQIVSLAEVTMNSLIHEDNVVDADFLARVDLLGSMGYTVMISDYLRVITSYSIHYTKLYDLKTYFTAGPKEVRAWTVRVGATAPEAAGVIHTDFQHGFIRAEVIAIDDYLRLEGEQKAKEAGKMRVEGKEYVVRDGDVT